MLTPFLLNALLVSVRLFPVLVISPILLLSRIPLKARLLLALTLSVVLASGLNPVLAPVLSMPVLLGELLLGVLMAFGFHAAYAGLDMAGKLIDAQMGLNAAGVFDPGTVNMSGLVAELLLWPLACLFLVLDLHHDLLRVVAEVLIVTPPGSVSVSALSLSLAAVMTQQFLLAFMMVVPVVLGLWLIDVAFALLSRSMPQANVYFLSLPVKLGIGLLILLMTLPTIVQRLPLLIENALKVAVTPGVAA